jgi:Sec-independent protein secretion pathway component TatC
MVGGARAIHRLERRFDKSWFDAIAIFMRVSLLSGVILAMPVIVYQIIRFVLPGLTARERRWLLLGVPFASLLFLSGAAFHGM